MATLNFDNQIVQFRQLLKPYALKLTKDFEDAQDLLQDTMLKALANRDKFKEGTNLKGWLYTIMRNTFITRHHRATKRNTFIDTTPGNHYLNATKTVPNEATSNLMVDEIEHAINRLDRHFRDPFNMYNAGYKYQEIAEKLHLPMGTVKNRIHMARKELKKDLHVFRYNN